MTLWFVPQSLVILWSILLVLTTGQLLLQREQKSLKFANLVSKTLLEPSWLWNTILLTGSSKVTILRSRIPRGQYWCLLKLFDRKNMGTKYEHCTVEVCRPKRYVPNHSIQEGIINKDVWSKYHDNANHLPKVRENLPESLVITARGKHGLSRMYCQSPELSLCMTLYQTPGLVSVMGSHLKYLTILSTNQHFFPSPTHTPYTES